MTGQVLVLNATYEPLNVCSLRRACVLLLKAKAELVDALERPLRSASASLPYPVVIRLLSYVRRPARGRPAHHPPRGLRPRRPQLPVLRRRGRPPDGRPRAAALARRPVELGQRRHRLRAVQPPQGRPAAARDRHAPAQQAPAAVADALPDAAGDRGAARLARLPAAAARPLTPSRMEDEAELVALRRRVRELEALESVARAAREPIELDEAHGGARRVGGRLAARRGLRARGGEHARRARRDRLPLEPGRPDRRGARRARRARAARRGRAPRRAAAHPPRSARRARRLAHAARARAAPASRSSPRPPPRMRPPCSRAPAGRCGGCSRARSTTASRTTCRPWPRSCGSRRAATPTRSAPCATSIGRVLSIAEVHDLLTSTREEDVDSADLVRRLCGMLRQTLDGTLETVRSRPMVLAPERATALALVLCELAANAIEHGGGHGMSSCGATARSSSSPSATAARARRRRPARPARASRSPARSSRSTSAAALRFEQDGRRARDGSLPVRALSTQAQPGRRFV